MIGKEYSERDYNCAHFVAEYYKKNFDIDVPTGEVFSREFVIWMRKHFQPIQTPCEHALVLMVNYDGTYHVGVYCNFMVKHNFKPVRGNGSVCAWTMSAVNKYYKEVRFYQWLQ